jgi:hypothetical protein
MRSTRDDARGAFLPFIPLIDDGARDLRHGLRMLRRAPVDALRTN